MQWGPLTGQAAARALACCSSWISSAFPAEQPAGPPCPRAPPGPGLGPSSSSRPLVPRCMPVCSKEAAGRLRVTQRHLQHLPRRLWSQVAWQPRVAPEGPASCCGRPWGLSPASGGPRRPPRIQGDGPATGASSEQGDFQVKGPSPFGIQATALVAMVLGGPTWSGEDQ